MVVKKASLPSKRAVKKIAAKKAAPAGPAGPATLKKQRVDVTKLGEGASPLRGNDNAVRLAGGHQALPFDLPAYVTITRLLSPEDGAVEAHVISIDLFTYGRTVHIRLGKKKGWRKGRSPETNTDALSSVKIWVNKTKVYEGKDGDKDDTFKNGERP